MAKDPKHKEKGKGRVPQNGEIEDIVVPRGEEVTEDPGDREHIVSTTDATGWIPHISPTTGSTGKLVDDEDWFEDTKPHTEKNDSEKKRNL